MCGPPKPTAAATHFLVASQHGRGHERLVAQLAPVLLVSFVDHLDVNVQGVLPLEGGVTVMALESPLTCE